MKMDISVGGGGAGRAVDPKYFSFRQKSFKKCKTNFRKIFASKL